MLLAFQATCSGMQTTPSSSIAGSVTYPTSLPVPNRCANATLPTSPVSFSTVGTTLSQLPGTPTNYSLGNGLLNISSGQSSQFKPLVHPSHLRLPIHNSPAPGNGCIHHGHPIFYPPFPHPYPLETVSRAALPIMMNREKSHTNGPEVHYKGMNWNELA